MRAAAGTTRSREASFRRGRARGRRSRPTGTRRGSRTTTVRLRARDSAQFSRRNAQFSAQLSAPLSDPASPAAAGFYNSQQTGAGRPPDRWSEVPKLGLVGAESQPKNAEYTNAFPGKGLDFSLWGPLLGQMPSFAGALFGRSLFSGCKCEACVYSIDTMVMYLDEDTMGMFDEADIDRILMDRFCYGIKWMCETGRVSDIAPHTRSHPAHPAPPLDSGTARRATTSCPTTTRT